MALCVYPDVTLAQARERQQEGRKRLTFGVDPMADRKQQASAPAAMTLEQASRQWWAHWPPRRSMRHADCVLRRMEADVFPEIGSIPESAFRDIIKKIEARGHLIFKRALQTCGQIMRYAVAHDLAERNPASDVRPADVLNVRKKRNYARVDGARLAGCAVDGSPASQGQAQSPSKRHRLLWSFYFQ